MFADQRSLGDQNLASPDRLRTTASGGNARRTSHLRTKTRIVLPNLGPHRDMCRLPLFAALVATLALTLMASVTGIGCALASAVHGRPGATLAVPMQLAQGSDRDGAALDRAYFVGAWETQNREFGRDVQVIWTVRSDSSLKYDFVIDGAPSRGSTGTWDFNDGMLIENWDRADGSTGSGRASIEKIDDQTGRLTNFLSMVGSPSVPRSCAHLPPTRLASDARFWHKAD